MFKTFHSFIVVAVIALFLGCGGSSSTGSSGAQDGRIEVHNNVASDPGSTQVPMYVYYINRAGKEVETEVGVGERKFVTEDEIIKGGTEVPLTFRPKMNCYVVAERKVVVDGNVLLRVTYIGPCGSGVLEIETVSG